MTECVTDSCTCYRFVRVGLKTMPYRQGLQEALQTGRQSLKEVVEGSQCEGVPAKHWSRCNRQDLLDACALPHFRLRGFGEATGVLDREV